MSTPEYESIEQAEAVAVRVALERGYLKTDQLREALLLREQLRMSGRQTRLLALLGSRYIPVSFQNELSEVYFAALNVGAEPPPAAEPEPQPEVEREAPAPIEISSDELAIPEFILQRSSELFAQPPEDDSDEVRDFIKKSSEMAIPDLSTLENVQVSESGLFRWLKKHLPGGTSGES